MTSSRFVASSRRAGHAQRSMRAGRNRQDSRSIASRVSTLGSGSLCVRRYRADRPGAAASIRRPGQFHLAWVASQSIPASFAIDHRADSKVSDLHPDARLPCMVSMHHPNSGPPSGGAPKDGLTSSPEHRVIGTPAVGYMAQRSRAAGVNLTDCRRLSAGHEPLRLAPLEGQFMSRPPHPLASPAQTPATVGTSPQPPAQALPETGFLRQPQVLRFVPISKSTLWRRVRDRSFPQPLKLSERVTVWRAEDIRLWIHQQRGAT